MKSDYMLYYSVQFSVTLGSTRRRPGTKWKRIGGLLKQIDSGPFGIVCGVNHHDIIFCRSGIVWGKLMGKNWRRVPGRLKHISCGEFGHWGVNKFHSIFFRLGVTHERPEGMNICALGIRGGR